jgi:glycolate oxidase iron-sulfur subunit
MVTWHRKPLKDLVDRCFRCGLCRAVCPVFLQDGREPAVARAKLRLAAALSEGDLQPSERLAYLLSRCLACGACEAICPADVAVTEAVLRVRCELVTTLKLERPDGWPAHAAPADAPLSFDQQENAGRPDAALMRWSRYLQAIRSRPGRPLAAVLALLSSRPAEDLSHQPVDSDSVGLPRLVGPASARTKVAYFPGCADLLWPRLWRPTFDIFRQAGVRAVVPPGSYCCGYLFLEAGDLAMARKLVNENIKAFERLEVDAIVTGCSTGQRMLGRYTGEILGLTGFPVPVTGLSAFFIQLAEGGALPEPWAPVPARVCYLLPQGLGRPDEGALELLSRVPDLEPILLPDDRSYGESLFLAAVHPELHEQILGSTVNAVIDRGCEAIVAQSPLLMYLLDQYLERHQKDLRVVHLAEILAMACVAGGQAAPESLPRGTDG